MAKRQGSGKGRNAIVLEDHAVVRLLRVVVEKEGGQSAFARHHGFHQSYINKVINGKARVREPLAKALGLRRVYVAK